MENTSKELKLYKQLVDKLTYAADKLFYARKSLSGIYDAEVSSTYCLNKLSRPFSLRYYGTTDSFLKDIDKCKDKAFELERLLAKLEVSISDQAKDFARRIIKLEEEEE